MIIGIVAYLTELPLLDINRINGRGFVLSFAKTGSFRAGQVVGITVHPDIEPRLYSIASGEDDVLINILFTLKQDGVLTPAMAKLTPCDRIFVTKPQGGFIHDGADSWFIATGTGIAPFRSMIRSGVRPLRLLQGGRTPSDLYFREDFYGLSGYVPCLTQSELNGVPMRLTTYLASQAELPAQVKYYICGNPNMVVDVRALLIDKGVPFENILSEIYF